MEEGAEGSEEGQAGPPDRDLTRSAGDERAREIPGGGGSSPTHADPGDERTHEIAGGGSWPYVIVSALAVWLCRSFWFPGTYVVGFDTYAYSGPNLEVTERAIRNGRLPILNDLIFGGVPHLGNPSAAALYPPQFVTLLFDTNRAMGLLVTAHVVVLGVGMVLLLRRLGVGRTGAATGGGVLVASGAALTKTIQFEQILVIAWAPLLLAAIHSVLNAARPWRSVAATSAVTAAVLLAGHPQHVYQTIVLAIGATIGFAIGNERWRRLPHLALGAVLGAMIAAPQLIAVLHATADSAFAGGRTLEELNRPGLSLLPTASARALFGTVQGIDPAFFVGSFESVAYVGVVAAIVAVVGFTGAVIDRVRRPWAVSFAVVAALALVWALGPRTFVFDVAFDWLPGFDLARASARWLVVVVLVASLFAGIGVDALGRRVSAAQVAIAGGAVAIIGIALAADVVVADTRATVYWLITAAIVIAVLVAIVALGRSDRARSQWVVAATLALVGLGATELIAMSVNSIPEGLATDRPFTSWSSESVEFLAANGSSTIALTDDGRELAYEIPAFRPNANVLAGVPSIDGYDGGVQITERWATALQRFTPDPPTELPLRNSLTLPITAESMTRLGVRYVLLDRDRPAEQFIPGWIGPMASSDELDVWENPGWLGSAIAWKAAIEVADPVEAAEILLTTPTGLDDTAIVDRLESEVSCARLPGECAPTAVTIDARSPEHLVARTDFDVPTVVGVTRQALPGWRVSIDGEPAEERTVDGLFLGVEVPAGEHTITWRYRSPWLVASLVIALIGLAATVALAFADTVRGRVQHLK